MIVHSLSDRPTQELARALAEFEARFTYPLGHGRSFRISHGEDYTRFYRSMGDARCFVAEDAGRVLGTLSVAIRAINIPGGPQRQAAYIGDLKIDPESRGSFAFLRLAQAALAWARPRVSAAYGIVMAGTAASPDLYTGRIGIPGFLAIGKIIVLRLPASADAPDSCQIVSAQQGEACHRELTRGRYHTSGGRSADRSEIKPIWLIHPDGLSCGRLEDTRRAKRLVDSDGVEMQSAHLGSFAWRTPVAAGHLLQSARREAAKLGLPAFFLAVAERDLPALEFDLGGIDRVIAPATIYGAGLPAGTEWEISSSEI